ncbi:KTI12 protein [Aphelenchoides avenae]|nr:KTI12 protein [Aphelenchus avenae]
MPFLLVTGCPASGKTTIVSRIVDFFKTKGFDEIDVVSDEASAFTKDKYNDSKMEKMHRNALRSTVQRLLTKNRLVICDSLNYIKGFRYELFCVAKHSQTTYAVLWCKSSEASSTWLNEQHSSSEKYSETKIHELFMRYEEPDEKNRWDSPLFVVPLADHDEHGERPSEEQLPRSVQLPLEQLYACLVEGKDLLPNKSTQSAPSASTNWLHDLDRVTQCVVSSLMDQQRSAVPGDKLVVPYAGQKDENKVLFSRQKTLAELSRLRKQFISYTRMHPVEGEELMATLFVSFLNSAP